MLLDTGADISLLDESHLTDRQRTHMVPSRMKNPKAASGNEVEILGELRMTVRLGKAVINDHPFQVVRNLVVPLIGGADFLSRLSRQSWDWANSTLTVQGQSLKLEEMYRSEQSLDRVYRATRACRVVIDESTKIAKGEEALVSCRVEHGRDRTEYLLEPSSPTDDDEHPVRAMCSLLRPTDSHVTVRVVNVGEVDEEMPKGTVVGMACPEFKPNYNTHTGLRPTKKYMYPVSKSTRNCYQGSKLKSSK